MWPDLGFPLGYLGFPLGYLGFPLGYLGLLPGLLGLLPGFLGLLPGFLRSPVNLVRYHRLLGSHHVFLYPLHPWTLDQPQRPGIPMAHAIFLQALGVIADRPWGATYRVPSAGGQLVQIREIWTVVRMPGILLLKLSCGLVVEVMLG
jgi:hypothetical protein